jgi:hypothetical protein
VENICFVNSVVQMMMRSGVLREWVLADDETLWHAGGPIVRKELRMFLEAAWAGDRTVRNARLIRNTVAKHKEESGGGENYADFEQHCAVEFVESLVAMCGEKLERLMRFERRTEARCGRPGCGADPVVRPPECDTVPQRPSEEPRC